MTLDFFLSFYLNKWKSGIIDIENHIPRLIYPKRFVKLRSYNNGKNYYILRNIKNVQGQLKLCE